MPGMNRSIAHSSSASGSSPSNWIESSPASSSSINSIRAHAASTSSRCSSSWPARGRPATPSSSSLSRRENAVKLSPSARAASIQPGDQSLDRGVELVGRHAPEQRLADLGLGPEAAAHEDVVGLPPHAAFVARRSCPGSRGRRPSAARRRGGSRRGGAAGRRSRSPKRSSRPSISRPRRVFVSATEKLQCGSPVQAIELPRTGLMSSGKPIRSSSADASSTDSFGMPVTMKFCWRVSRMSPP